MRVIKSEMFEKLTQRKIKICNGVSNKHRRVVKPWWNENLSVGWNEVCLKESLWVKCKEPNLKQVYKVGNVQKRNEIDRQVRKAKRLH